MAAVEGGQADVVKVFISTEFQPTDPIYFEKSKNCKDQEGNTPLHIAYKNMSGLIHEELIKAKIGAAIKRNIRGLAPEQMNHKRIVEDLECDSDPDYLFLVKKNRADFLKA